MHLQGFDDYGAAAALWGASETGFAVSGVFRDMADFAVLVLFQKDDPFGHPLFSYLPGGDLTGLVLDYCGVFWWKQSVASNPSYPQCTVAFSGNWNDQDVVWLHVGGSAIGKTVFGGQDSSTTIARHFANFINGIFDGAWASASGSALTDQLAFVFPFGNFTCTPNCPSRTAAAAKQR